ncbi:hypothetical protein TWF718_002319 [Orbilia javanica]|uniref:F-box domain-containing protein n=1 Tax=Orbilia javanica TaxID=47235 RepID=A0AAN8MMA1_9PEZI
MDGATNPQLQSENTGKKASILDLPPEIHITILKHLPPTALKSLRLTHPIFKSTAASLLFRKWTLSAFTEPRTQNIHQAQAQAQARIYSGGGNRWLDERDKPKPYREGVVYTNTAYGPVERSVLRVLKESFEKGSEELEVLFENLQELVVSRFDVFGGVGVEGEDEDDEDEEGGGGASSKYSSWGVEVLKSFLGKMRRLKSIDWDMPPDNLNAAMAVPSLINNLTHLALARGVDSFVPDNTAERSLVGFSSLTNLTNLELKLVKPDDLNGLNNLPHLTTLTLECVSRAYNITTFLNAQKTPFKLRSLTLKNDTRGVDFPAEIFTKYLSSLQSLSLISPEVEINRESSSKRSKINSVSRSLDGDKKSIWTHLMENGIYLEKISTFGQSPSLVSYLMSYPLKPGSTVLKSLEVRVWPYITSNPADPRSFVHSLWHQVVPLHRKSLQRIAIFPETSSITSGGGYNQSMAWQSREELGTQLGSPPAPEVGLFMLSDEIKTVLKGCEKLESLEMGSLNWRGASEFLRFVLFGLHRRVWDVGFHLNGWSRRLVGWDYIGSSGAHYAREFANARKPLILQSWDSSPESPIDPEIPILDDNTWKRLRINLYPLKSMWFVGGGAKAGRKWKLMDSELELEICNSLNGTARGWGSVNDVLRNDGEGGVYDRKMICDAAVLNGRYDPVEVARKHNELMSKLLRGPGVVVVPRP